MRHCLLSAAAALAGLFLSAPAAARVHEETPDSFVIRLAVVVPASPQQAWDMLVRPAEWWDGSHSFSGDAANLSLHPRAGGCFCEVLPNEASPNAAPSGSVEHMRVIFADDGRALRMTGALGPLQAGAVTGVLTIFLKPGKAGTQILWEYAVSGHWRAEGAAAATDAALAGQILRLAEKLGAGKAVGGEAGEPEEAEEDGTGSQPADGDEATDGAKQDAESRPANPAVEGR